MIKIGFLIGSFSLLFGHPVLAQVCDQYRNPHSFACAHEAFRGGVFEMIEVSQRRLQGRWAFLTYADARGRLGPEFGVMVHPQNPHAPVGIVNHLDGSRAGDLDWAPGGVRFRNFGEARKTLVEDPSRTRFTDAHTAQLVLQNGIEEHALQCRIFIRRGAEHLQCRWMTLSRAQKRFILRGFVGFLRAQ
jgi:hypothetical protein